MENAPRSPFDELRARCSAEWPAIAGARELTEQHLRDLSPIKEFASDNTSVVVFGSFARRELTSGSDADWSLLIDGPSDPGHVLVVPKVQQLLVDRGLQKPGTTETFGTLVSSHELIHHIGGVRDTNQNLTRRILLLLESLAVTNQSVRERVLRQILYRYVVSDPSVSWRAVPPLMVPRFLLNDIVRFWRTMAVDYAAKRWEQSDQKWALRNAKLRMSRKLLFVAGLLVCFSFELYPPEDREDMLTDAATMGSRMSDFLWDQLQFTPIDLLARVILRVNRPDLAAKLMGSYDKFLTLINDREDRDHLANLKFDEVGRDEVFAKVRDLSHDFQEGLADLFFGDELLRQLVIKYGVF